MTARPPLTLDAIVQAVAVLRPDTADRPELAATLRIAPPGERAPTAPIPIAPPVPIDVRVPEAGVLLARGPPDPRPKPPRLTRLFALPDLSPRLAPDWFHSTSPLPLDRSPKPREGSGARDAPLLTPAQTARGLVKALLSSPSPSGPVDIAAALVRLARGEPLLRLPLRPARGLTRGATLVLDTGAWLDPFRRDALALLRTLRNLIGADRLQVVRSEGRPPELAGPSAGGWEGLRLRPGTPLLVLSDFGLSEGDDVPARAGPPSWARFAGAVREAGCEPIGLLPFPEAAWPHMLAHAFALLHWTVTATARGARRARERGGGKPGPTGAPRTEPAAGLSTLAMACAAAGRVDPELMRALRLELLPDSSPELEAGLWWSAEIGSRGATAATFSAERLKAHRAALRAQPELAARVVETIRQQRDFAAPILRMEEEIVGLELERPAGWEGRIVDRLRELLRTLLANPDDPPKQALDAARYLLVALPELDIPPAARAVVRDLAYVAAHLLGSFAWASEAELPSEWVARLMSPAASDGSPVSVDWDQGGLKFEPGTEGADVIQLDGRPPAVMVRWQARRATGWMEMDRPHVLPAPRADYAELIAPDGRRWVIEDVDVADSRPPLRLFALVHPQAHNRVEGFLSRLEQAMRQHAGLPATAPVLLRNFLIEGWNELPSWQDRPRNSGSISTWRVAVAKAVKDATAFLIVATEEMLREDWTSEVLRSIARRFEGGLHPRPEWPPLLAIEWGGSSPVDPERFLADHGLESVSWCAPTADDAASIGARLAQIWRSGPSAPEVAKSVEAVVDSGRIARVAAALQDLAMAFHTHRFGDGHGGRVEELDASWSSGANPKIWGFDSLPYARSSPEGGRIAAADFEFARFLAEYVYAGPVVAYLEGRDPFRPSYTTEELVAAVREGAPKGVVSSNAPLAQALKAFDRFAPPRARTDFLHRFDVEAGRMADLIAKGAPLPYIDAAALVEAIRPYATVFDSWRLKHEFSFSNSRSFPEAMEAYSGLMQHYLRSLARWRPEIEVELSPNALAWWEEVRSMFPASFEYLNVRERTSSKDGRQGMPVIEYADLFASLSDALVFALRARAADYVPAGLQAGFADAVSFRSAGVPDSA